MKTTHVIIAVVILVFLYLYFSSKAEAANTFNNLTGGYIMPEIMTPLDISGGIFPNGSNTPSATQSQRILEATNAIKPLDENGNSSATGKIGFLAVGASNPVHEWNTFVDMAINDPYTNPNIVYINGCIGGVSIEDMNSGQSAVGDYFAKLANTVYAEGITPEQVQAIWFKSDCLSHEMWNMTEEEYIQYFADNFTQTLQKLYAAFPNLQIVYTSGRNNPYVDENSDVYLSHGGPRAYFNQLGYREVMDRQITGNADLIAYGADKKAPVLTWSTPLYSYPLGTPNGSGHVWNASDVINDGLHPTESGQIKVATLLHNFFSTDTQAKKWYLAA